MRVLLSLLITFLTISLGVSWGAKKDRIKLKDVTTLTLYHGQWTTGRRTRPVPQLQCIGGTGMCKFLPKTVQCYNRGSDGVDIQWECKADIPSNMRFNKIEVTCEGYDYPEDDFVLTGSCGLEYSIDTTDGSRPFPKPHFDRPDPRNIPKSPYKKNEPGFFTVFVLASISFFMWLIYKCCINPMGSLGSRSGRSPPNPPPPTAPSPTPPPPPGFKTDFFSSTQRPAFGDSRGTNDTGTRFGDSRGTSDTGTRFGDSRETSDTGTGFFQGLGIGAIAGYLFANRGGQQPTGTHQERFARTSRREYVREEPPQPSWFNWFSSSTTRRRTHGHGTREESREESREDSSTSSNQSPSTTTGEISRNASGFGATKRR